MRSCLASAVSSSTSTAPAKRNGRPDLLQIGRTVRTATKVRLEPAAISAREGSFEVVSDQLYGLLTHQVLPSQRQHHSVLLNFGIKDLPQASASSVQKDSLISARNAQCRTHLIVGETLDISQDDHLALTRCQVFESRCEYGHQSSRVESALTVVSPSIQRIGPMSLRVKASWDRPNGVTRSTLSDALWHQPIAPD